MSGEMVSVNGHAEVPALVPPNPFESLRQMQSWIPEESDAMQARIAKCVTEGKSNWKKHAGRLVEAVGITMFTRRVTADGEEPVRYGVYMVLHAKNGEDFTTSGYGPIEDLPLLRRKFGMPPWPDGVPVILSQVETGGGKTRLGLFPGASVKQVATE
jgi:hypothetical protein